VLLTAQGFPPDTSMNHSETARELQIAGFSNKDVPEEPTALR